MKRTIIVLLLIISVHLMIGCYKTEPFFGKWVVSKVVGTSRIYAMSEEEMKSYIGKKAEFGPSLAAFDNEICENPIYKKKTLNKTAFYKDYRTSFENLGLNGKLVNIIDINISKNESWVNPGSSLIIKDKDTLLTLWDGVFFEMKRRI